MRLLKITSLALSVSMGIAIAASTSFAADNNIKTVDSKASFETAHSTARNRQHKHCHKRFRSTSRLKQTRLIEICHKHRHWPLHHRRKG